MSTARSSSTFRGCRCPTRTHLLRCASCPSGTRRCSSTRGGRRSFPSATAPRIFNIRNPQSVNTFLVDGQVAGTWRYEKGRVKIEPFGRLSKSVRAELEDEAERLARVPRMTANVALLGYGLAGSVFHAPFISTTPGLRLSVVVTGDEERREQALREHTGVEVVGTADRGLGASARARPGRDRDAEREPPPARAGRARGGAGRRRRQASRAERGGGTRRSSTRPPSGA